MSCRHPLDENLIYFGKITSTHGVRGKFKIHSFFENWQQAGKKGKFFDNDLNPLKLNLLSRNKEYILASLEGVETVEAAVHYRGKAIYLKSDALPPLEGEFYYYQLEGMQVKHQGAVIGVVKRVENFGGGDLLEIDFGNKTEYLPFSDDFVQEVSLAEKFIVITYPE